MKNGEIEDVIETKHLKQSTKGKTSKITQKTNYSVSQKAVYYSCAQFWKELLISNNCLEMIFSCLGDNFYYFFYMSQDGRITSMRNCLQNWSILVTFSFDVISIVCKNCRSSPEPPVYFQQELTLSYSLNYSLSVSYSSFFFFFLNHLRTSWRHCWRNCAFFPLNTWLWISY